MTYSNKEIMPLQTEEAQVTYDLSRPNSMIELAKVLKEHILRNNLTTRIGDKDYVNVEAWQFAGTHLGLVPIIESTENLSSYEKTTLEFKSKTGNYSKTITHYKYKAVCILKDSNTGATLGRAEMLCSNEESKKATFEEYAILSMAQTRAVAKAFRDLLGWTMKIAGFEATPVEEMPNEPTVKQEPLATDKQKGMIQKLVQSSVITLEEREATLVAIDTMTTQRASKCIENLLITIEERNANLLEAAETEEIQ